MPVHTLRLYLVKNVADRTQFGAFCTKSTNHIILYLQKKVNSFPEFRVFL